MSVLILLALFALLFVGSVAVFRLKEWGRALMVFGHGIFALYAAFLFWQQPELIPPTYALMGVIAMLFFSQKKMKDNFKGVLREVWQSILIIDDEEMIRKTVQALLIKSGYSVLTAQTGEEGLKVAQTQQPNLILLDVILPGIKGRDVCRQLKANASTKEIPVVFLTAKDSPDDIKIGQELGAVGHLTKPVESKVLIQTVHDLLKTK